MSTAVLEESLTWFSFLTIFSEYTSRNATMPCFRFLVLFFNCLLTLGSYFCFDLPSALQYWFQGNATFSNTTMDSSNCLEMSPQKYNLLYAVSAWTDAVVVLGAGILVDKFGNRVGVLLFSFLCLLGSSVFAMGPHLRGTAAMLPVMLVGRLIFGSGNGSLSIVQSRVSAFWFRDKELAVAFGATVATSRIGSVLNFAVTATLAKRFGLMWALWGGAIMCAISFLAAIVLGLLDKIGIVQQGHEAGVRQDPKELRFTSIKNFGLQFWLLVLAVVFFHSGVYPFMADSSKFIHDKYGNKYGYSPVDAAYFAGAVYFVATLSPFVGCVVDYFGKRGYLALVFSLLTVPVFGMLAFTNIHPLICTVWLGVTYTLTSMSLSLSIPLVVPQAAVGIATGVHSSIQMVGVGISNVIVGAILGQTEGSDREQWLAGWKYVMIYLLGNIMMCIAMTVLLNVNDNKRERVLNQSNRERVARQLIEEHLQHSDSSCYGDSLEPSEHEPLLQNRSFYSAEIN